MNFYTILTNSGINAIIQARASQTEVKLSKIAVGDGEIIPAQDMTSLANEKHRFSINTMNQDATNPGYLIIEGVIPSTVGGFYISEVAIYTEDNVLFAIGNLPTTYKPLLEEGSAKDLTIKMIIEVTNADSVTLMIDDSIVLASRKFVEDRLEDYILISNAVSKTEFESIMSNYSIINKPSIISPLNGSESYIGVIESSAMSAGKSYKGSLDFAHWQLSTDANFEDIVDEDNESANLIYSPTSMEPNTLYFVRVKHGSDNHLSSWSEAISFKTPSTLIGTPTIITPANNSINTEETVNITTSDYSAFSNDETHVSSTWQIATDSEFIDIVDQSLNDTVNLTSWTSNTLEIEKTYYARVKYKSQNYSSEYSDVITFTTPDGAINTPTILSPENNSVNMSDKVTIISNSYSNFGHTEPHLTTTWQIATDVNFTDIVDESIGDTVNLTSWTSGVLQLGKTYYARVKYNSLSYSSEYSSVITFSIPMISITAPTILSPLNNSINMNKKVNITTSTYDKFGHIEAHSSTTWQIATDLNFINIVAQSINDAVNLTSWISPDLPLGKTYYIRAKHNSTSYSSSYSLITSFSIPAAQIHKPAIISPLNNSIDLGKNVELTSDSYSAFGIAETHLSSTWQIATDQYFSNIISQSINDIANLTSWTSGNLEKNTSYYARVQYKSTSSTSEYSNVIKFTTKSVFTINAGIAGKKGFSVAPTNQPFALLGLAEMSGTNDPSSDNYGNYIHSNGSIVCYLPKTFYKVGHPDSPRFATYGANALDFVGTDVFENEAQANAAGYVLPRCFINAGKEQSGFFFDKYMNSKDGTTASKSVFGGSPISLTASTYTFRSGGMTGCTGILADAVVLSRARGERWNTGTAFMYGYLALVSVAQAQAATNTTDVAWYDATGVKNYPKGCNNNALSDVDDTTVTYITAGDAGSAQKPKTGATANFSKTTHNGSANGVADLNGGMFEVTIGITNFGSSATASTAISNNTIYVLKQTVDHANLTGGWNGANDVWGDAANLATKYDSVISSHPLGSSTGTVCWGNGTNAVFQNNLNGVDRDICGFIPKDSNSTNATGVNLLGNDYFYKHNRQNMVPLACGNWNYSGIAGLFYRTFTSYRSNDLSAASFRASAYFA